MSGVTPSAARAPKATVYVCGRSMGGLNLTEMTPLPSIAAGVSASNAMLAMNSGRVTTD